jgi:menaquinone-dependent protoporphyrinogen oxidase
MTRVLIVHASRHGGSAGIAQRVAETLRLSGLEAVVERANDMPDPEGFDGCVVGGGVYMGSWVKSGVEYLDRFAETLAARPVWLFSSGPLAGSSKRKGATTDPIELALGPLNGPGSGGRRRIEQLSERIRPRDHRVFDGVFDPVSPPASMSERFVRMMPGSKGILPPGDFRDWSAIEAWGRTIAAELRHPAAVAGPT